MVRPVQIVENNAIDVSELRKSFTTSLTQKEFAEMLNVSIHTVQSWEQGKNVPSGATLRLLQLIKDRPEGMKGDPMRLKQE